MTLHNLQVFIAVCEEGTMTDAAKRLNMTQPGVSKIISEMERYYETVFFIRKNRRFYLTAAGKQFLEDSRKVVQAFSMLEGNATHNQETKTITLGCTSGIGFSMVADVDLRLFKAAAGGGLKNGNDGKKAACQKFHV